MSAWKNEQFSKMPVKVRMLSGENPYIAITSKDELRQLDGLYASYHKQWWCRRQMYYHFKRYHTIFSAITLMIVALSIVVGSIWKESYAVVGLTAVATFIKGWSEFKKYSVKMDMCRFAYTTYEKTLIELKNFARGGLEDTSDFLVKMQALDEVNTDFTPPMYDTYMTLYSNKFVHEALV